MDNTIRKIIQKAIIKSYEKDEHHRIFDLVIKDIEKWYDNPAQQTCNDEKNQQAIILNVEV
jgi:hypothetical protein